MQRYGQVIQLDPDSVARYKELHASVWPEVLATISACHLTNYSIFLREPENLLFAYFEYVGEDFDADMAAMAADPVTQELVGSLHATAAAVGIARAGRVVGVDRGGLPPRLRGWPSAGQTFDKLSGAARSGRVVRGDAFPLGRLVRGVDQGHRLVDVLDDGGQGLDAALKIAVHHPHRADEGVGEPGAVKARGCQRRSASTPPESASSW